MAGRKSHTFRTIPLLVAIYLLSFPVYAKYSGGTGEPNDPYQIATAEDLIAFGGDPNDYGKNFILTADVDLDPDLPGGRVFGDALIAPDNSGGVSGHSGSPFRGVFDGGGHVIANLHIMGKYGYDAGLFGMLDGLVKDVNLTDVVVIGSPCGAIAGLNHGGMILRCHVSGMVLGIEEVGGLVGTHWNASIIDCRAQVRAVGKESVGGVVGGGPGGTLIGCDVQAEVSGERNVGGLVGYSHQGQILECRASATVSGVDTVGGLIGSSDETMIWSSSADCNVTAKRVAGGLAGRAVWGISGALIADCYARGSVAGSVVGGLAGEARHNQFMNCYAACEIIPVEIEGQKLLVGGLLGDVSIPDWGPMTVACFWDAELSKITTGASTRTQDMDLGTGLTTEQMQDQQVFENAGWDFDYTWMIREGQYPTLQWEGQN
jgi:hypothetical protein